MSTVIKFLFSPVVSINKRFKRRNSSSLLDAPPPPVDTPNDWAYGSYCWIATVEAKDSDGEIDRTFVGYSQNMNIAERTKGACDRFKKSGTVCGEPELAMRGGECDEVIFMKPKGGTLVPLNFI
jgi:hypothetical protein